MKTIGYRHIFKISMILRYYCKLDFSIFYAHLLKGLAQAKIIKNRWFYFGLLIWPYDVNMSID